MKNIEKNSNIKVNGITAGLKKGPLKAYVSDLILERFEFNKN